VIKETDKPITKDEMTPKIWFSPEKLRDEGSSRFQARGAEEKKNQVGRYLSVFFLIFEFFLWRFCAFLNKGSSKTPLKTFWGKSMSKTFGRKS
jgi:hypothetical protein